MNIGPYSFEQFREMAARFHGYPAPGLLLGGYMVEMAKTGLPEGTLFEALVETRKCLPDAVQLLTLCSTGNSWMRVVDLGRYALSLYDKHTGLGVRVRLDLEKLRAYPECLAWFMKRKAKDEQDSRALFAQIEEAGNRVCSMRPVRVRPHFLGKSHSGPNVVCPRCAEAYPLAQGAACLACQGDDPYVSDDA